MDDCIIIGAGPAGLTAAIYLARFHLSVRLLDSGSSRAATIPRTRNHAGFPDGIAGRDLLALMQTQAERYDAVVERVEATAIACEGDGFVVTAGTSPLGARTVLLATGVVNNRPTMPEALHDTALARGLIRYCPICDGYEITDKRVGVIGDGAHGVREALFLRGYTRDLTLVGPTAALSLAPADRAALDDAGIRRVDGPCRDFAIDGDRIMLDTAAGSMRFDSIYPAMGSVIRSKLAIAAGARATNEGCLEVDEHQRTSVPGLFAAGDVVRGLDQISHAMGEAGVAATAIRNLLGDRRPIRR